MIDAEFHALPFQSSLVALSPNKYLVAAVDSNCTTLRVLDVAAMCGERDATGGMDRQVNSSGKPIAVYQTSDQIVQLSWSPDSALIALLITSVTGVLEVISPSLPSSPTDLLLRRNNSRTGRALENQNPNGARGSGGSSRTCGLVCRIEGGINRIQYFRWHASSRALFYFGMLSAARCHVVSLVDGSVQEFTPGCKTKTIPKKMPQETSCSLSAIYGFAPPALFSPSTTVSQSLKDKQQPTRSIQHNSILDSASSVAVLPYHLRPRVEDTEPYLGALGVPVMTFTTCRRFIIMVTPSTVTSSNLSLESLTVFSASTLEVCALYNLGCGVERLTDHHRDKVGSGPSPHAHQNQSGSSSSTTMAVPSQALSNITSGSNNDQTTRSNLVQVGNGDVSLVASEYSPVVSGSNGLALIRNASSLYCNIDVSKVCVVFDELRGVVVVVSTVDFSRTLHVVGPVMSCSGETAERHLSSQHHSSGLLSSTLNESATAIQTTDRYTPGRAYAISSNTHLTRVTILFLDEAHQYQWRILMLSVAGGKDGRMVAHRSPLCLSSTPKPLASSGLSSSDRRTVLPTSFLMDPSLCSVQSTNVLTQVVTYELDGQHTSTYVLTTDPEKLSQRHYEAHYTEERVCLAGGCDAHQRISNLAVPQQSKLSSFYRFSHFELSPVRDLFSGVAYLACCTSSFPSIIFVLAVSTLQPVAILRHEQPVSGMYWKTFTRFQGVAEGTDTQQTINSSTNTTTTSSSIPSDTSSNVGRQQFSMPLLVITTDNNVGDLFLWTADAALCLTVPPELHTSTARRHAHAADCGGFCVHRVLSGLDTQHLILVDEIRSQSIIVNLRESAQVR